MRLRLLLLLVLVTLCVSRPDRRPLPHLRKFRSEVIDKFILNFTQHMADEELAWVFSNTFPNTLDTTVKRFSVTAESSLPSTFVITGDIDAMWLRDSMNQLNPYMPFLNADPQLKQLVLGLVLEQAHLITTDPFANAFNDGPTGKGHQKDKRVPNMTKGVFEGKYELDSLVAFFRLSAQYASHANDTSFTSVPVWMEAVATALSVIEYLQEGLWDTEPKPHYQFQRETNVATDTLYNNGHGVPGLRCGMSRSFFRGSDDATALPFQIPANAMAVVNLRRVAPLLSIAAADGPELAKRALALADEIDEGIKSAGMMWRKANGSSSPPGTWELVYAYEVDGYGSQYFMDDANIPGLLSLPYMGYVDKDDATFAATRRAVLDPLSNPYYFEGTDGSGVGGPHNGYDFVWPMALIQQAWSSSNETEIAQCLQLLKESAMHGSLKIAGQGYGFVHESFSASNISDFTRPWFAWVNGLFGELLLHLAEHYPSLIF